MAVLGSTAKPTTSQEQNGLNTNNQMGQLLTLPAGGPWRIYRLGGWLAGVGSSSNYKLCLWSSSASLLRSSATGSIGSLPFGVGQSTNAEFDITEYVVAGGTSVIVGWARDPTKTVQNGRTGSGSHYHDTATTWPATMSGWSTETGGIGSYLYYEAANAVPTAATIDEPDQNEIVNDQTPLIDWTHHDPDGDPQSKYQVQVDNASGFPSPSWDSGQVTSGTTSATCATTLTRGVTYYARVRTADAAGWGPWSSVRTFKIASLPVGVVSTPAGSVAMPMYYVAGSGTTPKITVSWTFSCADGGAQSSASIKVYDAAGTTLLHTHAHTGSAVSANISGYTPVNGTKYQISVTPTCSHGAVATESAKKSGQCRWARASYYLDMGSAPLTLSATASSTANNGLVVMEYTSTASTVEPTTWYASIASATKARYAWHRVTLLPQSIASPTSPALNSVTFSYSNNVLVPDDWNLEAAFSVDEGTYVYGTQSLKHTGDGTDNFAYQDVEVTPFTDYVLSGRLRTGSGSTMALELVDPAVGTVLASVSASPDIDWTRYSTPVWNSGEISTVRVRIKGSGAAATYGWADALKLEASRVVTPWTPGFLGQAVVLDAGGVSVDALKGGIFRLRGSNGLSSSEVALLESGLVGSLLHTYPDPPDLAFKESWATSGGPLTMSAGVDQALPAGMSVTYPGNPAMVGRKVIIRAYIQMTATYSAVGEINLSLMTTDLPYGGDGSTRLRFTRDRVDSGGALNEQFAERTAIYDADGSITFSGQVRTAAASTVTVYASATSQYVSRIGYQVLGYI